jgi:beta-glucosidase/6-phospho-beta-glucosidase/beta-galactosidase/imidazolonepropionase-like amidohydrolase
MTQARTFPTGFTWAAATAAHQVEGNNSNCETWAEEHAAGSPYVDKSGDAIDHYNRYAEDIALVASLGLKAYRFSVEWARVEPVEGTFDAAALAHYRSVVDSCVKHGLEPLVTLHHFTSPKWLMALGGWKGARTPELFARYVEQVMPALGPAVKRVVTMNECNIGVLLQSMFAQMEFVPPIGVDIKSWRAPAWRNAAAKACGTDAATYCAFQMAGDAQGVATISAAHRAARAVIRRVAPNVKVALSLALSAINVLPGGEQSGARSWWGNFRQWLPVIEGDDYFALQNYTREIHGPEGQVPPPAGTEFTNAGYEYAPAALAAVARRVAHDLKLPILITENGYCGDDDTRRVAFISETLAGLHAAMADGVPIVGYTYWSAFDNFEWVFGYAKRFGIIGVERSTQQRIVKPSAQHLASIARNNALPETAQRPSFPGPAQELALNHSYTPPMPQPGIVFTNVRIFDGSGSLPFAGEVRVDGNRISAMARNGAAVNRDNASVIDGNGGVLMPGLTEAHAHLTWPTSVEKFVPGMSLPPEELTLTAARNARILLDHGFTSAYSAGALGKRIEPALQAQIDSGGLPGPRLVASSVEREPPNDGANFGTLDPGKVDEHGAGAVNVAAFVTGCKAIGAKAVKFLISGESALKPGASMELLYTEEELMAAGVAARENDLWLTGHAHAAAAVKLGVKAGFRVLYHCTYADEEALDLLESVKDSIFVAPSIGIIQATLDAAPPPHFDMTHMKQDAAIVLETQKKLVPELRKRGIRLLPGGDYGFPFNPNGRNARDLELWVQHFGYTPAEVLHAATALGGEIMGRPDELGQVKEGYLADLLLVDGDPTQNVAILQNKNHLKAIMKDGKFHKAPGRGY